MLTFLLCCLIADDATDRARALLALAAAQVQAAKGKQPVQAKAKVDQPPAKPTPVKQAVQPLRWGATTDPDQLALFRGTVQIGVWHKVQQVYWPVVGNDWGEATTPPIDQPARC